MAETISKGEPTVLSRGPRGLEELERIIGHGLGTFVEVGRALLEIQHRRLYLQAGYRTFAVYTSERWDLSESHAYRQIEAAKVIDVLSPTGESLLPANEAQARELAPLVGDPDTIRAVWSEIAASGERVTARAIRAKVAAQLGRAQTTRSRSDSTTSHVCPVCGHTWTDAGG
jgi:hypothetical protein